MIEKLFIIGLIGGICLLPLSGGVIQSLNAPVTVKGFYNVKDNLDLESIKGFEDNKNSKLISVSYAEDTTNQQNSIESFENEEIKTYDESLVVNEFISSDEYEDSYEDLFINSINENEDFDSSYIIENINELEEEYSAESNDELEYTENENSNNEDINLNEIYYPESNEDKRGLSSEEDIPNESGNEEEEDNNNEAEDEEEDEPGNPKIIKEINDKESIYYPENSYGIGNPDINKMSLNGKLIE